MVAFAQYATLQAGGESAAAATLRQSITDYNAYDCLSTLRLRDWLLAQGQAAGVERRAVQLAVDGDGLEAGVNERSEVAAALMARAEQAAGCGGGAGGGAPGQGGRLLAG